MSEETSEVYKFVMVNLKYAVTALRTIRDLEPGMWKTQQDLADQALKDMSVALLSEVDKELEKDREVLEGPK